MSNNQNLKPYAKGHVSTSPGRPKGASLKSQIQNVFIEMMEDPIKVGKTTMPFITAYKKSFIDNALNGGWSSKILAERLFSDNILDNIDRSLNRDLREDEDFQTYRVIKKAHDIQQRILLTKFRKIYCMAGRRAGKTEANILKAIQTSLTADSNVLIICLTQETAMKLYWKTLTDILDDLGIVVENANKSEGLLTLFNGSIISLKGNNSTTDREKFRGAHWDLVIIDEVQSQQALPYLINDIIEPTLLDKKGQLILSGTGPRVKGTYWELLWTEDQTALKLNWNLSENPFITDYETVLETIKSEKGLTDESPLFQREYLGLCVYDSDAQVWRLNENNYYTDEDFRIWIQSQPVSDIRFTAGLDYGYRDNDAFVIVCYSQSLPEKFIIYEHKANRQGITELYQNIKKGLDAVQSNPLFNTTQINRIGPFNDATPDIDRNFYIFCDTNEQKISQEFRTQYNLPTQNAYKYDKDLAIELLQEEVRKGNLKVKRGSVFEDEANKTIWSRNDKDELTRKIDDDNFHPDLSDALIYSLRWIWKYSENSLI